MSEPMSVCPGCGVKDSIERLFNGEHDCDMGTTSRTHSTHSPDQSREDVVSLESVARMVSLFSAKQSEIDAKMHATLNVLRVLLEDKEGKDSRPGFFPGVFVGVLFSIMSIFIYGISQGMGS